MEAHPYLTEPELYLVGLPTSAREQDLLGVFSGLAGGDTGSRCCKFEHSPDGAELTKVLFNNLSMAEKAYATIQSIPLPQIGATLSLAIYEPPTPDSLPKPYSKPRQISCLPDDFDHFKLFDLCRPFGPIYRITQLADNCSIVHWYEDKHTRAATSALHCSIFQGQMLSMIQYDPKRVPSYSSHTFKPASNKSFQKPVEAASQPTSRATSPTPASMVRNVHDAERESHWGVSNGHLKNGLGISKVLQEKAPGESGWNDGDVHQESVGGPQQENEWAAKSVESPNLLDLPSPKQPTVSSGSWHPLKAEDIKPFIPSPPRSTALMPPPAPGLDPCNLFVKNIALTVTSENFYGLFSDFGRIVSARLMKDPLTKESKGFGFVSYSKPEEAAAAMKAMEGHIFQEKALKVCIHEPKAIREAHLGKQAVDGELSRGMSTLSLGPTPPISPLRSTPSYTYNPNDQKLAEAIKMFVPPAQQFQVITMMMGLSQKEKALCLFSTENLKRKIVEAQELINMDEGDLSFTPASAASSYLATPGSAAVSIRSPSPAVTARQLDYGSVKDVRSLAELSYLPCKDLMRLVNSTNPPLALGGRDEEAKAETAAFLQSIATLKPAIQKQKLGDRLLKITKSFGVKNHSQVAMDIVNKEDLESLAYVSAEYPQILKEKAKRLAAASYPH